MKHIRSTVKEVRTRGNMSEIITSAEAVNLPTQAITAEAIAAFEQQQTQAFVDEYNALCKRYRRAVGAKAQIVDGKIVAVNTVEVLPQP